MSVLKVHTVYDISTHALTEGDGIIANKKEYQGYFNSRPHGGRQLPEPEKKESRTFQLTPSRRATYLYEFLFVYQLISTHALTEGDQI